MSHKNKEFKKEAIRLALTSPQPITKTARDLGIKSSTLYSWVNIEKDIAVVTPNESGNKIKLVEQLTKLRKENIRLREEREILKKGHSLLHKGSEVKFRFIRLNSKQFSIQRMCKIFEVSRAGFYAWQHRFPSRRESDDQRYLNIIKRNLKKAEKHMVIGEYITI